MRLILLAAGQGLQLDGFNKLLIRDPHTGLNVLETFLKYFDRRKVTVVVGYRAINVMNLYPDLHYVYNANWALTNNSYSLGLAINDEPCFVSSSDLFIDDDVVRKLHEAPENCILTSMRPNRTLNSLNCILNGSEVEELYQGDIRNPNDPEAIGIYKIADLQLLRAWKRNCLQFTNLFVGQNLPLGKIKPVHAVDKGTARFDEVNTPIDYINLIEKYANRNLK